VHNIKRNFFLFIFHYNGPQNEQPHYFAKTCDFHL